MGRMPSRTVTSPPTGRHKTDLQRPSHAELAFADGAHALALLSPGPDFFLVVRAAMVFGVRHASGVCLGIALGNGAYIAMAAAFYVHAMLNAVLFWRIFGGYDQPQRT